MNSMTIAIFNSQEDEIKKRMEAYEKMIEEQAAK